MLAVSDADRRHVRRLYGDGVPRPVHVVPTGVDTSYFAPEASPADSRNLVFTGSMDWLPNEDAMVFFCREVLPLIRADEPGVTLSIVGRAPTPTVEKLADGHGITVTGRVDDVRPYMRDAAVYIVPLRIGGGTRLKIFEAMAMGKAVVSTTVGAEGLPVTSGEHLLLADEPRTFARAVVRLLRDVGRRRAARSRSPRARRRALRLVGGRRRAGRRTDSRRSLPSPERRPARLLAQSITRRRRRSGTRRGDRFAGQIT